MLKLDHMVLYVLLIALTVTCVFTSPVLSGYRHQRLLSSRNKRDIQVTLLYILNNKKIIIKNMKLN